MAKNGPGASHVGDISEDATTYLPVTPATGLATTGTPSQPAVMPDLIAKFNEVADYLGMVAEELERAASLPQGVQRHFQVVQHEVMAIIDDVKINQECLLGVAKALEGLRMVSRARPVAKSARDSTPLWLRDQVASPSQPGASYPGATSQPGANVLTPHEGAL